MNHSRSASWVGSMVLSAATAFALPAAADPVPNPNVVGPIPVPVAAGDPSHDYVFGTPAADLARYGYVEKEFFIEGTATSYSTPAGENGTVVSGGHPYRTRIIVRRPISPLRFNGTVLLEWENVSAGYDLDANWAGSWEHFLERGYAWVGVSAQRVGLEGYPPPIVNRGLKAWSPTRYGTLDVTDGGTVMDDSLSYDIFSQAAQSIRRPVGVNPMHGFPVRLILAIGASQSAGRLATYHDAIYPLSKVFDGFQLLVGGAGLRTDLNVKVFQYLSETELGFGPQIRMADSDHFRSWEVAGMAHFANVAHEYRAPLDARDFGGDPWPANCDKPPFSHVRGDYVINTEYDDLVRWIDFGIAPPTAPKIQFSNDSPPVIVRDEYGIAKGGIRLPDVAVPVALNTGTNSGAAFCVLYGTYQPFDDATLKKLYPTHYTYVEEVARSAWSNVRDGYISFEAAQQFVARAAQSNTP
jgi:hypothetical protein